MNTNAIRQPKPTIKLPKTRGYLQPRLTDSMNPLTKPPNPIVTTKAPNQSTRAMAAPPPFGKPPNENENHAPPDRRLMQNAPPPPTTLHNPPPTTHTTP